MPSLQNFCAVKVASPRALFNVFPLCLLAKKQHFLIINHSNGKREKEREKVETLVRFFIECENGETR